ncbi:PEP-CTERM sorting domain-containing protein [Cylindrospermum sp. FACHB-282]|uniref:PEP-CTERM sorting domain-containing protein n=1 Tax=Cylindrospermum sp. FACHB-282 TaxID=2692794 RepID=UPI0016888D88|nr:PEP-CTERM sorting domain-containing protein [Cylindrospermum sp. FACHB-282]MBD2387935.1 PEP-CTERM sorting domain-containing protein [Cylindrospermum sp. FACHB-282]
MKHGFITLHLLLIPAFVGLFNQQAFSVTLNTVNWDADNSANGSGSGTLDGVGAISYTTSPANGSNAGTSFTNDWSASTATNNAYGGTFLEGVALGTASNGTTTQTISFTGTIVNPILLFNYTDANTSFDFSSIATNGITLLDFQNASLSGSTVTVGAANNGFNDGFAVSIAGSFTNGFSFTSTGTGGGSTPSTAGFTVGQVAEEVPEPASMMGLIMGLSPFGMGWYHKRKQLQKSA